MEARTLAARAGTHMFRLMLNINTARKTNAPERARRQALVDEIREHMAIMRAAAERGRVRGLIKQSVSLTHLHVLTVLRSEGPLQVGELASALDVSVASATGIVSRMVERGLVERARSGDDRRVVSVSLAPGGQAALDQLEGRGREHFAAVLGRLTLEELELVRGAFNALHEAHEAEMADKSCSAPETSNP
jgi:DNA-binding MarR family transcriptional regulator